MIIGGYEWILDLTHPKCNSTIGFRTIPSELVWSRPHLICYSDMQFMDVERAAGSLLGKTLLLYVIGDAVELPAS